MVAAAIVTAAVVVVGADFDAVSDIVVCVATANGGSYRRGQGKRNSAGRTTSIKIASTLSS